MSPLYKQRAFPTDELDRTPQVCTSELPSVLRRWRDPGCQLALWQRQLAPDLVRRLDGVALEELPSARFVSCLDDAGPKLDAALRASALRDAALVAALGHDMAHLVSLFAGATDSLEVEVRIEAVRTDACRKFHVDSTLARLVTTYVGPGTVWVPPQHADRAVRLQDGYAGPLYEMPRFAVGVFAGSEAGGSALVHRSPRIAGAGTFRLFFCVNRPVRAARGTTLH